MKFIDLTGLTYFLTKIKAWVSDTFVKSVAGKGLSTNDYTTDEKTKLAGIATGANKYVHPTGDGNLHVPVTGTTNNGKVLKSGSTSGSIAWGTLSKSDVGLGNVDNTTDLNKPISTAVQTALNGKAPSSHRHGDADITSLSVDKLLGVISIDHLPAGALERCIIVADDTARFKLTTANVQNGDTVKVTSSGLMYFVKDETKLASADGYEVYTAGSASSVPWSGVTGKPASFTPASHTHTKSQITDFPASLKNPTALTLKLNGVSQGAYDGSVAKEINVTAASIGALTSGDLVAITNAEIDALFA